MQLSLLSPAVLALVAAAAVLLGLLEGVSRQLAFLALNLAFLLFYLLGARGTTITVAFILVGFLLITGVLKRPERAFWPGLTAFVLLFVYMKHYTFLDALLPSSALTSVLSTLGLSFLFFKIVHVVIEAHSGTLGAFDPLTYANYCTNFTTFTMGPIQRYQDHRSQWFDVTTEPTVEEHLDAVIRILVGLFKTYVVAEWVKPYNFKPGADVAALPIQDLLIGMYSFNIYLYLNFAGYCDVMIGAGTLFGVRPPENFDKPFIARNVSDFWQRQHRSLTLWLTDYVFTPTFKWLLQIERFGRRPLLAANLSLVLAMIVSGLWHGTSFGFLLFGLLHGVYLVIYRTSDSILVKRFGRNTVQDWRSRWWVHALAVAITFNVVSFAFIFFQLSARDGVRVLTRLVWS
jgi:D-alanyl-lipoteichoic acid acyltransferase DltB (MBOAT superfamily)